MVHVGVDLDKRSSQIAIVGEDGNISQQRLANDAVGLAKFFAQLPAQTPIATEASGTWWWFVDLLEQLGHRPVLSNPKQTKAIAAARLKNDRVDAERLALLLRGDLLPTVWIPPAALREARELIRHRIQLSWLRGVVRNRLHAMLARRNLQPRSGKSWLTQRGQRELQRPPLGDVPNQIREDCGTLLPTLDAQIRRLDAALIQRWGQDPRVRRLTTIPGIGPFICSSWSSATSSGFRVASGSPATSDWCRAAGQRRSRARRPYHQSGQPPASLGLGARRDAGHPSARPAPIVVSRREEATRATSGPGPAGPSPRRDRVSRLERRVRVLCRCPSRSRAGVSSDVVLVFGPIS
jgi:transposase